MKSTHPMSPRNGRERGFSLTELMVAMAIFGIVLAASLPGFRSMMRGHQHSASVGQVTSRLFLTRQMAVRDRTPYVVALDLVNSQYSVFQDNDGDGVLDPGETTLGPWALRGDVALQNVSWTGNQMTFFPNGSASETADIRITSTDGRSRTIRVSSITGNAEVLP